MCVIRSKQDSDMVRLLQNVRKGRVPLTETDNNSMDQGQDVPFLLHCAEGNLQAVRCSVYAKGFDINQGDKIEQTGLMWAAHYHRNEVVDFLLLHPDIDPTRPANSGSTALHGASEANNVHALQMLLRHPKMVDKDIETKNLEGKTAADLARYLL